MTHGAKQGRKVPGTKTSGNYADEESKAGEHQNAHEKQTKELRDRALKEAVIADMIMDCKATGLRTQAECEKNARAGR